MTIRLFLQNNGFDPMPTAPHTDPDLPTFVRYYYDMALAVLFETSTGQLYGLRFASAEDVLLYERGEWTLNQLNPTRVDVMRAANLCTIQTGKHLKTAFDVLEKMTWAELMGYNVHGVTFGDRVIVPGSPTIAGTVVDMNQHHVFVRTEGGVQEFKPAQIIKI